MTQRGIEAPLAGNTVRDRFENGDIINAIFEQQTANKLYNPIDNPQATDMLAQQVEAWKAAGDVVVAVFGGFDAPFHINHQRFLLDCKTHGVIRHFDTHTAHILGTTWDELDTEAKEDYTRATLADNKIKMIVSTDGDERIAGSKGNNPKKGNSVRPLQAWSTRAHSLLSFSLQLTNDPAFRTPIVDAVTIHDQLALPDSVHADPVDIVATLKPDVWTLFHEAERDIDVASTDGRLSDIDLYVLTNDPANDAIDPLTGRSFSTTGLVRRIKGE